MPVTSWPSPTIRCRSRTAALDHVFNAAVAKREIEAALANNDADLANSFVELAAARHVPLDPAFKAKVKAAVAEASSTGHAVASFARGFVTGVPDGRCGAGRYRGRRSVRLRRHPRRGARGHPLGARRADRQDDSGARLRRSGRHRRHLCDGRAGGAGAARADHRQGGAQDRRAQRASGARGWPPGAPGGGLEPVAPGDTRHVGTEARGRRARSARRGEGGTRRRPDDAGHRRRPHRAQGRRARGHGKPEGGGDAGGGLARRQARRQGRRQDARHHQAARAAAPSC